MKFSLWNQLSREKSVEQGIGQNARLYWSGWGGRIRTSDWLIQRQVCYLSRASDTRNTISDTVRTTNSAGQAGRP